MDPVGLSTKDIIATLVVVQAFGEIMNIPPPQLDVILDKAKVGLELKPSTPAKPPPPTPPTP